MDQFCFLQPVDRLSQCVVIAVATTAHRGFYASLGETLGVQDGDILRSSVGVMDQCIVIGLPVIQSLLTKATYCQPCQVQTYVKSDTHS